MRILMALPLLAAGLAVSVPANAQTAIEGRVNKLEREMRAVQRKVFPGGAQAQVEPQITAPQAPIEAPGTPAGSPIANLESRVAALESQQMTLTGQVEQAQYKLRQMEEAFEAYRRANDGRLTALEGGGAAAPAPATRSEGEEAAPAPAPTRTPGNGGGVLKLPADSATRAPAAATAAPAVAAAGVDKPAPSGDPAEDAYVYGYRLWSAKRYSDAATQLKTVVDKYPKHRRASWAQNLIGRAYLDDGKPSLASIAFYDNYKKMPDGERAPDSLFYLADALVQLKKPKDACEVYAELSDVYADRISATMKADIQRGRTAAKCG
jgi:TolA-binding protein